MQKNSHTSTQYLHVAEGKIAFDDQGEGPLIICMPAAGDLRSGYRFLTPLLVAEGYRVVTMDMRGQGESSVAWQDYSATAIGNDLLALIRHLGEEPVIVFANSKATGAAIWASVEEPHLISHLILTGVFAQALSPLRALLMARILLADLWGLALYRRYFPVMYPVKRPPDFDEHLCTVMAMLKEKGRLKALRKHFSDTGRDWDARVPFVTAPTLIVMGSKDPDFPDPEKEARSLAERLQSTQAQVEMIDGGHHLPAEMPDQVAQIVLDFLRVTVI